MTVEQYKITHGVLHTIEDHRGHIAWRLGSGNTVELFSIEISSRRKGYGTSLISQMIYQLKKDNASSVYGFTRARMIYAQLFYLSVGFRLTRLPAFYSEGNAVMFCQRFDTLHKLLVRGLDMKIYSQNGEDAIIHRLLYDIEKVGGTYNKTFLEIGVSVENDFIECNTGRLLDQGWTGHWIDEDPIDHPVAHVHHLLPENINQVCEEHGVPKDLGVLSIDVDGVDYYLWEALDDNYQPAIVVIEYNSQICGDGPLVVPYSPDARWDGTNYFGANAIALTELAHKKGYLLYSDARHVNLIFIRKDLAFLDWVEPTYSSLQGAIVSTHPCDPLNRKYTNPSKDLDNES